MDDDVPHLLKQLAKHLNSIPAHHAFTFTIFDPLPETHIPQFESIKLIKTQSNNLQQPSSLSPPHRTQHSSTKMFCDLCKKSFASLATWTTHQQSSKHQSKSSSRPHSKLLKLGSSPTPSPLNKSLSTPSLADVLTKLRWAKNIEQTDPQVAETVYWNIAKALWSTYTDPRDTGVSLSLLLNHLSSTRSPIKPDPADSLYTKALLALARLLIVTNIQTDIATCLYLHALPINIKTSNTLDLCPKRVRADLHVWQVCNNHTLWSIPLLLDIAKWFLFHHQTVSHYLNAVVCLLSLSSTLVAQHYYVEAISWVLEFLTCTSTVPNGTKCLLLLEGMIAARNLGDRVSIKLLFQQAVRLKIDHAIEVKFLVHTSSHQHSPIHWRLTAAPLLSQVIHTITLCKNPALVDTSFESMSLVMTVMDLKVWDSAKLNSWDAYVLQIAHALCIPTI